MRHFIPSALAVGLAACSNQPKASAVELDAFDPPTVQVRGDVQPRQQARFARLDRNGDGFVTAAEFPRNGAGRVARFDVNRDGKVSRGELVEGALARFARLDADRDGQVTPQELTAAKDGVD